jgi:hypothetical protein
MSTSPTPSACQITKTMSDESKKLQIVDGRTFTNEEVRVESTQFINCIFKGCALVYDGGTPSFIRTGFLQSHWVFEGPAQNTISLLTALYHGAGEHGRSLVDGTFANIRRGTLPLRPDIADATDKTN